MLIKKETVLFLPALCLTLIPTGLLAQQMSPKIGLLNVMQAIAQCTEGKQALGEFEKKAAAKQEELEKKNNEIQELQKQLQTQARQLNDESRAALTKSIETKTTELQRAQDDARKEFGAMQNEIFSRIGNRVGPLVQQYAKENNFSLIVDTSQNSQVIYFDPTIDITAEIIKRADAGQASAPATKPATTPTPPATKP
jgi:outer membrane protein